MKQILIPYDAGLLSAYGIGNARIERFEEQQVLQLFSSAEVTLSKFFRQLFEKGVKHFSKDGFTEDQVVIDKELVFLRFIGQESTVEVPYGKGKGVLDRFQKMYKDIYGHWLVDREIEIESIRSILSVKEARTTKKKTRPISYRPSPVKSSKFFNNGNWTTIKVYLWEQLKAGAEIKGPAMVASQNSTTILNKHWNFKLDENNNGLLRIRQNPGIKLRSQNH